MIYIIESYGYFKVGYTNNWKSRESAYNTHCPRFTLLHLLHGCVNIEKYIHLHLSKSRFEWLVKFNDFEKYVLQLYKTAIELPQDELIRQLVFKDFNKICANNSNNRYKKYISLSRNLSVLKSNNNLILIDKNNNLLELDNLSTYIYENYNIKLQQNKLNYIIFNHYSYKPIVINNKIHIKRID